MEFLVLPHSTLMGGVIIALILTIIFLGMCINCNKKRRARALVTSQMDQILTEKLSKGQEDNIYTQGASRGAHAMASSIQPTQAEGGLEATQYDDELEIYGKMEIKEELVKLGKKEYTLAEKIATGSFATVQKATIQKDGKSIAVAAKLPKSNTEQNKRFLTARLNFMANEIPRHVNVISLVAVDPAVPIMFLDLCEGGTMASWVKTLKDFTPETDDLMIRFSLDIANGLKHLHGLKVLHRRLGIRNVLLKSTPVRLIVKLTGFGPLESEIDSASSKQNKVPFKWLPPESIMREQGQVRIYNEAVDMWSYGVTLWEMFSRGEMPFKALKSWQLKPLLLGGERLPCPKECLPSMYDKVMMTCWALEPTKRPSAAEICTTLSKLFLGENSKDYYYAAGQVHAEEIEWYAYSPGRKDVGIYENNPTGYQNASVDNEVEFYLEAQGPQSTYMNTNQMSMTDDADGGLYMNTQPQKIEPTYLQLIG